MYQKLFEKTIIKQPSSKDQIKYQRLSVSENDLRFLQFNVACASNVFILRL